MDSLTDEISSTQVTGSKKHKAIPLSMGMILVTLGIVYGDIATSPMYTMKTIVQGNGGLSSVNETVILGALSLLIWTLTLITTVMHVLIAMKADNHGEGGIFALYTLVRRTARWLIIPAMIGGATLLADGTLTPAVTVTTAIEGLRTIPLGQQLIGADQGKVLLITIAILCGLFFFQRAGTSTVGKVFSPVMTVWFLFLGITGLVNITGDWSILRAFNPIRGITFLFGPENKAGMAILGSVFLCTTGAEALYSDMGHVGKANIYASWPFVKACLILNYLGQGAWILANKNNAALNAISDTNPFFRMLPEEFRGFAVGLSTLAAIIASQALITGSYTVVSEAIRLDLMPHMRIIYPSDAKGQIYIPLVNNIMWIVCISLVLYFGTSSAMEAAYGLTITVSMLATTVLLYAYLRYIRKRRVSALVFLVFFMALELTFFVSSLAKFTHGGYVSALLALALFMIMYIWRRGTAIERGQSVYLPVHNYIDQIQHLSNDEHYPLLTDNLVFLTNDSSNTNLDRDILYSILDKQPKRASAYWFLNIKTTNEPYTMAYSVENFGTDNIFKVQMKLGFRVNQRINGFLRQIIDDMIASGELAPQRHPYSVYRNPSPIGDFKFCLLRKSLVPETDISNADWNIMQLKYAIRRIAGSPDRWFGLENSSVIIEYVPLFTSTATIPHLVRVAPADVTGPLPKLAAYLEEDRTSDIFSADIAASRDANHENVAKAYYGGEDALFTPIDVDDEDEE